MLLSRRSVKLMGLLAYWWFRRKSRGGAERTEGDDGRLSEEANPMLQDGRDARASQPKDPWPAKTQRSVSQGPRERSRLCLTWCQGSTRGSRSLLELAALQSRLSILRSRLRQLNTTDLTNQPDGKKDLVLKSPTVKLTNVLTENVRGAGRERATISSKPEQT